jgi:hypothetical protein
MEDIKVETHYGPRENPYVLYRNVQGMYYWKPKANTPRVMEGLFTSKDKALSAYIRHLKSETKPYHKNTRERFCGNPWESTWRLPAAKVKNNAKEEVL